MKRVGFLVLLLVLVVVLAWLIIGHVRSASVVFAAAAVSGGGRDAEQSSEAEDSNDFPFMAHDLPPASDMFAALKTAKPTVKHHVTVPEQTVKIKRGHGRKAPTEKVTLRPERDFEMVLQREWPKHMRECDAVSLHFSDEVRSRCRFGDKLAPAEVWRDRRMEVEKKAASIRKRHPKIEHGESLREAVYSMTNWCNFYNATFCLWVYRTLARKMGLDSHMVRIVDPSSGWGDRAIAACAFGARSYYGCDPNTELQPAYRAIFERFAPVTKCPRFNDYDGPCTFRVFPDPFSLGAIDLPPESVDIVHTSPPFFALEDYPAEGGRVARELDTLDRWDAEFYRPYLEDAWALLVPGGFLALYIDNVRVGDDVAPLADMTVAHLAELGAGEPYALYGFQQMTDWPEMNQKSKGTVRPLYVWRKAA